jgi:hypothetical protein
MPRFDKSKLYEPFRERLLLLEDLLDQEGVDVLFYCGFRSCADQAKLWRSTRSAAKIRAKIKSLNANGFDFLAKVIHDVGPQHGRIGKHVTRAIPGMSYHNYGMATDGVVMVLGKPDWEMTHWPLWQKYGSMAERVGLAWAGNWTGFKEYVHVQYGKHPTMLYDSPENIKALLEEVGSL